MTAKPESEFPTIRHAADVLAEMVANGCGELPVQILIVPDSTLVALAKAANDPAADKVRMMEFTAAGRDMGLLLASVDALNGDLNRHRVQ